MRVLIFLAFAILGLLIGNLVGFTSDSVTASIIPLLFAFGGGSAIAFMQNLNQKDRKTAAGAILSMSVGCLLGVYIGLIIAERQLLTPADARGDQVATSLLQVLENDEDPEVRRIAAEALGEWQNKKDPVNTGSRYLRSERIKAAEAIDQRLHSNEITLERLNDAYEQMYKLATEEDS